MSKFQSLADLRPAAYNPRTISTRQRTALQRSYLEFGDLSGIVVNLTTDNIVGGHQRTDVFKNRLTRIRKREERDSTGTVAIGHVIVPRPDGGTIRIPYREVRWDRSREMAANIAANAGGGEFDDVKLGKVLARLQRDRFPIELVPLDPLDLRRAERAHVSQRLRDDHFQREGGGAEAEDFAVISPEILKEAAQHACPSCGYRWSGSTKPSFAELHRLSPDNPSVVEARALAKSIREKTQREGKDARAAAVEVATERDRRIARGEARGRFVREKRGG